MQSVASSTSIAMALAVEEGTSNVLTSSTFDMPLDLDDRTRAGVSEVCQLMRGQGLTFDEARLQLVFSRMAQMGVDESGMPTDPKTFTFDQVRARGEVPKPWRRDGSQKRRCIDLPSPDTPTLKGVFGGRGMFVVHRWDFCGCLPPELSRDGLKRHLRNASPKTWLIVRFLCLALAALLMILLGFKEEGAPQLPGLLVEGPRV